jgi:RsiW-degrading membrane proteinase PrsW (M82 family)
VFGLAIALLPVVVFLAVLVLIDTFKLIPLRWILRAILAGALAAVICSFVNPAVRRVLDVSWGAFSVYASPAVEEAFKGFFIVYLTSRRRIAFPVDALIYGFSVGAGFAIIENANASFAPGSTGFVGAVVRGFGTAVMHGGATVILAITSRHLVSTRRTDRLVAFLPGFALAALVHSLYNQFVIPAQYAPVVTVAVISVVVAVTFRIGERKMKDWLGVRFDTDQELLEMINTGRTSESRIGAYLESLRSRFPGAVVADMVCLLRIHLELSVRAKGILLMREAGFKIEPDPDVGEKLAELKYLEKSIGRTGLLAIKPMLNMSDREIWQLHMIREA